MRAGSYLPCCRHRRPGESSPPFSTTRASSKEKTGVSRAALVAAATLPPEHSSPVLADLSTYLPPTLQYNHPGFGSSGRLSRFCPSGSALPPGNTERPVSFAAPPPPRPAASSYLLSLQQVRVQGLLHLMRANFARFSEGVVSLLQFGAERLELRPQIRRRQANEPQVGTAGRKTDGYTPLSPRNYSSLPTEFD